MDTEWKDQDLSGKSKFKKTLKEWLFGFRDQK